MIFVQESDLYFGYFHCCGDEDLFPFRCAACDRIMVFCYECDTLYPDLNDLENHGREAVNHCWTSFVFSCPNCCHKFERSFMENPSYYVSFADWMNAGYERFIKASSRGKLSHSMTHQKLAELLPQGKHDLEKARAIVTLGFPAVAPILPELLEWLQDYNWPIARVLAPFLATIGLPLLPEIRRILATNDDIWKYHVLSCLVQESPALSLALEQELRRMANAPSTNEKAEDVDEMAREILGNAG